MATTEDTRRQLFETVRANLGEPAAEALMAVTIPANTDLATRRDLDLLRAELHADMAELRADIRGGMSELRTELRGGMSELRTELRGEMSELRTELYGRVLPIIGGIVSAAVGIGVTVLALLQR